MLLHMMDVTACNFRKALALVREFLPNASFVSFDLEFTGLGESRPSQLDTPQTRYAEAKRDVDEYVPIQFGLAIFHRNKRGWEVIPFNFNLAPGAVYYPPSARYPLIDRKFTLQGSTVTFLTQYGFDFDKCLRLGISWLPKNVERDLRKHVEADIRRRRGEVVKQKISSNEYRMLFGKLSENISKFITGAESSLELPSTQVSVLPLSSAPAERAAVFRFIREEYPRIAAKSIWTPEGTRLRLELHKTEEEAAAHREEDLLTDVDDIISRAAGFRYVIDLIVKARVPLLTHNGLIDVTKLYGTFVEPLPKALPDFKRGFRNAFPSIYDTRLLLEQLAAKDNAIHHAVMGKRLSLGDLVATLCEIAKTRGVKTEFQTFIPTAQVSDVGRLDKVHMVSREGFVLSDQETCSPDSDQYGFGRYADEHFEHEAGSDAMQTGFLFGVITVLVENHGEIMELETMEGKIPLTSCGGYRWLDFGSTDEDEFNRWFGEDVIIVSRQSSGERRLEATSTIQAVVAGTSCESVKYEIKFAGPDAFLIILNLEKSEKISAETLVKMQTNATKFGVNVCKYSPESLSQRNVILRKNKKRKFSMEPR